MNVCETLICPIRVRENPPSADDTTFCFSLAITQDISLTLEFVYRIDVFDIAFAQTQATSDVVWEYEILASFTAQ